MGNRKGDRQGAGAHTGPPRTREAAETPTGKTAPERGQGRSPEKGPRLRTRSMRGRRAVGLGCGRGSGVEGALHADRSAVPWWLVVRSRGGKVDETPYEEL